MRQLDVHAGHDWAGGWEVFDYRLCLLVMEDHGMHVNAESLLREEYTPALDQTLADILSGSDSHHRVCRRVFEIIRLLAVIGRAIIVGRAGNFVTQGMPGGIHVRLVAPEEQRLRMMRQVVAAEPEAVRKEMHKQDAQRARFVKDYFSRDLADPSGYDLVLNMGNISQNEAAEMVVAMIRRRLPHKSAG